MWKCVPNYYKDLVLNIIQKYFASKCVHSKCHLSKSILLLAKYSTLSAQNTVTQMLMDFSLIFAFYAKYIYSLPQLCLSTLNKTM